MGLALLGVAALLLIFWLLRGFASADPRLLAQRLRLIAGSLGLGVGVPLLLSGRVAAGLILCGAGAWGLGWFGALVRSKADLDGRAARGAEHADADGNARQTRPAIQISL
jgi:hypothetical protein